jgi:hypothetical protein
MEVVVRANDMSTDTRYLCALCGGPLRVQDNLNGGLISVNVDGPPHKAAHRTCPVGPTKEGKQ